MRLFPRLRRTVAGLWQVRRDDCQVRISLNQKIILYLLVFDLFWFVYDLNRVAMMTFFVILGTLLGTYYWARQVALKVSAKRSLLSSAVQVGDELEELIELKNDSWLPVVWMEFNDRSNIPGHKATGVNAVDGLATTRWHIRTVCSRRGVYAYGVWEMLLSDPLGIFLVKQTYHHPEEVLVYPPLADLPSSILPISKNQGDVRSLNQPLLADTVSAMTTRPYQPGDMLRNIHWRTTAKRDSLYVKVFAPEAYSTLWVLPDLHSQVHSGEGEEATLEKTVILTATMAHRFLNERMAVGMLIFGRQTEIIQPLRGNANLWVFLRALAMVETTEQPDLGQALQRARRMISGGDSLLIITPSGNPSWLAEIAAYSHVGRGGHAAAILIDPAPAGGISNLEPMARLLGNLNCDSTVFHSDQIIPKPGFFGAIRRWEFVSFGTGQVFTRQRPRQIGEMIAKSGNLGKKESG